MRVRRAGTTERPVLHARGRLARRALGRISRHAGRLPWLFVASGGCFVTFGYLVWHPLAFLVAGVLLLLAEVAEG